MYHVLGMKWPSQTVSISKKQPPVTILLEWHMFFVSISQSFYIVKLTLTLITAPPRDFEVSLDETNNCTLTWCPPPVGANNSLRYMINCSGQNTAAQLLNTTSTLYSPSLHPHVRYRCCVFVSNEFGDGEQACVTFFTYESGTWIHCTHCYYRVSRDSKRDV